MLKLPAEIRNRIWRSVLNNGRLHVIKRSSRDKTGYNLYRCSSNSQRQVSDKSQDSDKVTLYVDNRRPAHRHWACVQDESPRVLGLALLQTCRQIHREAALLPFSETHFVCGDIRRFVNLVGRMLIHQASALRQVTVQYLPCLTDFKDIPRLQPLVGRLRSLSAVTMSMELITRDSFLRHARNDVLKVVGTLKVLPLERVAITLHPPESPLVFGAYTWTGSGVSEEDLELFRGEVSELLFPTE